MATVNAPSPPRFRVFGLLGDILEDIGDVTFFSLSVFIGCLTRTGRATLLPVSHVVGVRSMPVVAITGLFIGMVLAVQSFNQFAQFGLGTRIGAITTVAVVRELGPVFAATMLAGRVGGAMAAELATMRTTEQIDALACLGVNPVHYLATPRFLACVLLIPLLTVIANFMGVIGGALICTNVYNIDSHFYWQNMEGYISLWDLVTGLIKPLFFGGALALVSCHHGMRSEGGAEGVGRAATRAFVTSFLAVLVIDFFLAVLFNEIHEAIWPGTSGAV